MVMKARLFLYPLGSISDTGNQSDHPAIDSRYLLHEAQQAYYRGLPENIAIASVTSTPADAMGEDVSSSNSTLLSNKSHPDRNGTPDWICEERSTILILSYPSLLIYLYIFLYRLGCW